MGGPKLFNAVKNYDPTLNNSFVMSKFANYTVHRRRQPAVQSHWCSQDDADCHIQCSAANSRTSLSCVIDEQRQFLISLTFEKDCSTEELDTIS